MQSKLIILLLLLILSGCQQWNELTKPKPVEISGLGSLQSVKNNQFNEEQLAKLIKELNKRQSVNEEDANAMSAIYKRDIGGFLNASTKTSGNDDIISKDDVENYLFLMLQHDNLRSQVNQTTQQAITQEIKKTVRFDESKIFGLRDDAGNLAGSYINAYNKAAAKDRTEKRAAYDNQRAENKFNLISGFEQAALEITQGKKENITAKEKQNAEQFLNELKEYNESLPANRKILDANGRLISPAQMSDRQKDSMEDILSGKTDSAGDRLSDTMRKIYDELRRSTEQQVLEL